MRRNAKKCGEFSEIMTYSAATIEQRRHLGSCGMLSEFGTANTFILVVYLAGMVAIGLRLAGRQKTTEDYFLAGRNMPWLAVGMSMFASLTSATTYMGVPAFAYRHNIAMIFGVAMSLAAAPILSKLFYPVYRRQRVTTSYEYILVRYGPHARRAVSALFVLSRLGWLGIVIYAPAKAISVAAALPLVLAIILMGLLAVTYTVLGGLSAVIWTDVVQFVILFGGAVWLIGTLVVHVPGGAVEIVRVAAETGKLDVFDWTDLTELTALSAVIGWFFVFLNDYGTDQVTVQRLMAVRTDKGVVKAIAFNAVNDLLINGMLIFIGIGMFAYFQAFPNRLDNSVDPDGMLPFYIMHILPPGVSGLLVTAIFAAAMSSVDSGINSLSTVIVNDWVKPWRREHNRNKRCHSGPGVDDRFGSAGHAGGDLRLPDRQHRRDVDGHHGPVRGPDSERLRPGPADPPGPFPRLACRRRLWHCPDHRFTAILCQAIDDDLAFPPLVRHHHPHRLRGEPSHSDAASPAGLSWSR